MAVCAVSELSVATYIPSHPLQEFEIMTAANKGSVSLLSVFCADRCIGTETLIQKGRLWVDYAATLTKWEVSF